ncbi:MAG: phage portal protein, partial [Candidatus Poseidoniales archaeon]
MAVSKTQMMDANPLWKDNVKHWQFLMDSFLGGKHYKEGEYLTSYIFESREEYEERLENTALDNHVKAVVAIYNSFLFRQPPKRDYGSIANDPGLLPFLADADLDGRSFNSVMRDISTYATVYGNVWCVIDKPATVLTTRAEELQQGIRPYISIFTPDNVLDWNYSRSANGAYMLDYLKIYEGVSNGRDVIREYTPETISVISVGSGEDTAQVESVVPNEIGRIPAVCVYAQKSPERGIGISDVADVASMQQAIFNELSELEQIERISNHPSLVKTPGVRAHAGAGALIDVPEDTPEGLKPYLLQPSSASIDSLLNSINQKVEAIDRMSHMGGIRSIESRRLSGVALATEFQLLNARLAEKADLLEHAEEQIWTIFANWQDAVWDGTVDYPDTFNIQDKY